jgi:4-hydroxy-2-oxoheptanedioate aldolase
VCIVMVETARAVDNIDQIASVEGVDAVFIGPADLAITFGMAPAAAPVPGVHADAIEAVRRAASAAGLAVGISCPDAESALGLAASGYTFLPIGVDTHWVASTARAALAAVRGAGY